MRKMGIGQPTLNHPNGKKIAFIVIVFIILNACLKPNDHKAYLRNVLNNLEKVKSATYFSTEEEFAPGDTVASVQMNHFVKEFNNPADTTIGASYVCLEQTDTTQMAFCYDGKMRAVVYKDDNTIVIDSFKVIKLPFRPLSPPFFNYTKNIIKYALETKDSISIKMEEKKDVVYICLTIFEDRQVEFFGKACYLENTPYNFGETTSKYELWINKSNDLPYRYRREMSNDISTETISHSILNNLKIEDFKASNYFMPDFAIEAYSFVNKSEKINDLIGKTAPDWALQNASDNTVSLKDLKSKVVMIQFTSVSCGPCRASIPFLNELAVAYDKDDFDFIAIECTSKSLNALENYQKKNAINYKFLLSTNNVLKEYKIRSFPVFLFLDKDLIVREAINGYGTGTTDAEIKEIIEKMTH
jgi:thiol-disulfide isomerase/thioredoxin